MPKYTKRKDGRYVTNITDKNGKRIYFYGKTEKELSQKILEYNNKKEYGISFLELSEQWWDDAINKLAVQSITTYKPALRRLQDYFLNKSIKEIKAVDILGFLHILIKKGYAQKTIANHKLVANLIFTYAVNENLIDVNPCFSIKLPKSLPKEKRSAASLSDEEIIKKSYDIWLFPYIAIMTGMRKGEILALQWKDVDFKNDIINVSKSVYHDGDKPYIKEPKTDAGKRTVPLLKPLKEVLLNIKNKKNNDYIISLDGETPLRKKRFITLYKKFKEKTGIQCTAHQLRHSFATMAFECGVPVKSVQEILGHKQLSTTMDIYTDFRKQSFDEAKNLLNEHLKVSK